MFGHKLKLGSSLYERLAAVAAKKGYSSADELIVHVLEKTAAEADDAASEEEVRKRLQGLGYLEG